MRRLFTAALIAAAALPVLPAAAAPKWSAPHEISTKGGYAQVGVDGTGRILVLQARPDGLVLHTKPAGGPLPPRAWLVPITPTNAPWDVGGAALSAFKVNESGQVALVYGRGEDCGNPPLSCTFSLFARVGRDAQSLGRDEFVSEHAQHQVADMNERGDLALAWQTEGDPNLVGRGNIRVAIRPHGKRFRTPVEVSERADGPASKPSVAINETGDMVVAWQQLHPQASNGSGSSSVYAAYRRAGGTFGAPQLIWKRQPQADGYDPRVAVGPDGRATVLFDAVSKRVATSNRDGRFGGPRRFSTAGGITSLLRTTEAGTVAVWSEPWHGRSFATRAEGAGVFSPAVRLPDGIVWTEAALDPLGNLLVSGLTIPPQQHVYVGMLSRFGFAPLDVTGPLSPHMGHPTGLASNSSGAAAAVFQLYPDPTGRGPQPLVVVDRPADRTAPVLAVRNLRIGRRGFTADVACTEICRVGGGIQARRGRASAAGVVRATMSGSRTVRPGTTGRLSIKLSRRARLRLRKQLRGGKRFRLQAVVKASDTFGNARTLRFRASKRVLR